MKSNEEACYDFGLRLRALRKERDLTQGDLARKLGVSKGTVYKYESNTQVPPLDKLKKIAIELGTTIDYLAGIDDGEVIRADGLDEDCIRWLMYGIGMMKAMSNKK